MEIRSYNLVPGCVFTRTTTDGAGETHVVREVYVRHADSEYIVLSTWLMPNMTRGGLELPYNETVDLIGISVNPNEPDDTDYGTN